MNELFIWVFGPSSLKFYKFMKYLREQLQQVELKDGKNMFIRNKNPKPLLVLLFACQTILQT